MSQQEGTTATKQEGILRAGRVPKKKLRGDQQEEKESAADWGALKLKVLRGRQLHRREGLPAF